MPGQVLLEISNTSDARCFEAPIESIFKGAALFDRRGDMIFITQANDAYHRCGISSELIQNAIDFVRIEDKSTIPPCPFITRSRRWHDSYANLVDHELLPEIRRYR
ncbi:MAG: hypothetical protein EPN30_01475 [Actinomycetota bacterium]|nr:MAG: hypothetical protein EPN30_01475 [Actinomycetota bacterium]